MKTYDVFINHINFLLKQGRTAWLTLLYPIILIMLIGIGLSIGQSNHVSVVVFGSDPIIDALKADTTLDVKAVSSMDELEHSVRNKNAVMGVHVYTNASGKQIEILLDSTKQAVASNLLLLVDKMITHENMESGTNLKAIQERLAPSIIELKQKRGQVENLTIEIQNLRLRVREVKAELEKGRSSLASYRNELNSIQADLSEIDTYRNKLSSYDSQLGSIYDSLSYRETQRNNVVSKLYTDIGKVDGYIRKVDDCLYNVDNALAYVPYGTDPYYYLSSVRSELVGLKSDLYDARNDMVDMQNQLNAIDFNSMRSQIQSVRSDISDTSDKLSAFRTAVSSRISTLLNDLDGTDRRLVAAIDELDDFDTDLGALQEQAVQTDALLGRLLGPLQDFLGTKPENLLPPQINSKSVFSDERWIDMFFPSIIGIDMLLASLLLPMMVKVRMRDQGVELRMMRSKVSSISVVTGELLANYTISLFQLFLIFLIGIIFFGVRLSNPLGFLVVFLTVPFVFTSLGVLLSQGVNRSSTAFLLSLLIGIPMIFISGPIIPLEFMNPVISLLGKALPLYIMIDFGEKLMYRGIELFDVAIDYFYLLFFVIANYGAAVLVYALKR